MPGWVLEGLGGMFWHAFRCASHFITYAFYACSSHAFAITCALPSSLLVRRFVRSTSAASRRDAERARYKVQVPKMHSLKT